MIFNTEKDYIYIQKKVGRKRKMNNKQKKKKSTWQQYVPIIFFILIGGVCGFLMMMYIDRYLGEDAKIHEVILWLVGLFVGMYASIFFHMIIHEAGHLIFGLLSGYRFSSFRIGSFMWVKDGKKIKLRRLTLVGTGGQCLMTPPDMKDGKFPIVLYNLGGSIINMIFGMLFLALFFLTDSIPFLSILMLIFAVVGFMFAIMNGVPMRMGTVDNDGYNAFALTRNVAAMRSFWVQLKSTEQSSKGVRLKDMPDEWFDVPTDEAMKNSMVAVMGVFVCNRLMDDANFEEADKLMAHILEIESGIVGLHRNLLICDRMCIELITENRKEVINEMRSKEQDKFMKQMKIFPSVLRTEYVYALLHEKNAEKAANVKEQFEKWAKKYPYQSDMESERELMKKAEKIAAST